MQMKCGGRTSTVDSTNSTLVLIQIAVTLTTHPVNFVQKTRRMKMTIKEAMQATIIGLIVSIPFIIEIVKELVK
jgi:hypothetical protein